MPSQRVFLQITKLLALIKLPFDNQKKQLPTYLDFISQVKAKQLITFFPADIGQI